MGFSNNDNMHRVDFFKPSGKFNGTEAIYIPYPETEQDKDGIRREIGMSTERIKKAILKHITITKEHYEGKFIGEYRYSGMKAVILECDPEYVPFPMMFNIPEKED